MTIHINRNEVLLYLGYKGGEISGNILNAIDQCAEKLIKTAIPRTVWKQFKIVGKSLEGSSFCPQGKDIWNMLDDCDTVVLMAATLGSEVEFLIRRTQIINPTDAVILDACASSAIEGVCDDLCSEIEKDISPLFLTDRFSPGYGDFPLEQQNALFRTLDITRRIGVTLTDSGLMLPQKTVTAILGVSPSPVVKRFRGCAYCNLFGTCSYRKDGNTCGKA